jgi:hypothetical protein
MTTPTPDADADAATDMAARSRRRFLQLGAAGGALAAALPLTACGGSDDELVVDGRPLPSASFADERRILSEPMLQNPGADSVRVVWFTEFDAGRHTVRVGEALDREFVATSTRLSHLLEDAGSQVFQQVTGTWTMPRARAVFRHEALVTGLPAGERVPYVAISEVGGQGWRSGRYTLRSLPRANQALRILLTSDHQNNPMCSANTQKMAETVGTVDAVLYPGDFVSQPNRASEWFDRAGGGGNANLVGNPSFFQSLQGTARRWTPGSPYTGAAVLQHAPLYGSLGNHEYPGRWRMDPATNNASNPAPVTINEMDNDPQPRWYAQARYAELAATVNPTGDAALRERWIEDNSYEWTTYREMWSLPEGPEGKAYWAQRFGDVFIISLDANRVWRTWAANQRGKFSERFIDAERRVSTNTDEWGFGDINFRPFGRGSRQHDWLQQVLGSEPCRSARLRIVMSHQTMAGLGDNAVPVQAEIQSTLEFSDGSTLGPFPAREWPARWPEIRARVAAGQVRYVKHDYPRGADQWLTDIEPLLLAARVHLVHTGHSHLWNRTVATGSDGHRMHYLEASNFGNSFGAMFFASAQGGVSANQGPRNGGNVPGSAAWNNQTTAPQAGLGNQPRTQLAWNAADYPVAGEVHGRPMAQPSIVNPMRTLDRRTTAWAEQDLPFVASNNLCTFSTLDTATATVTSWCFDSRDPASAPVRFDAFSLLG